MTARCLSRTQPPAGPGIEHLSLHGAVRGENGHDIYELLVVFAQLKGNNITICRVPDTPRPDQIVTLDLRPHVPRGQANMIIRSAGWQSGDQERTTQESGPNVHHEVKCGATILNLV